VKTLTNQIKNIFNGIYVDQLRIAIVIIFFLFDKARAIACKIVYLRFKLLGTTSTPGNLQLIPSNNSHLQDGAI